MFLIPLKSFPTVPCLLLFCHFLSGSNSLPVQFPTYLISWLCLHVLHLCLLISVYPAWKTSPVPLTSDLFLTEQPEPSTESSYLHACPFFGSALFQQAFSCTEPKPLLCRWQNVCLCLHLAQTKQQKALWDRCLLLSFSSLQIKVDWKKTKKTLHVDKATSFKLFERGPKEGSDWKHPDACSFQSCVATLPDSCKKLTTNRFCSLKGRWMTLLSRITGEVEHTYNKLQLNRWPLPVLMKAWEVALIPKLFFFLS